MMTLELSLTSGVASIRPRLRDACWSGLSSTPPGLVPLGIEGRFYLTNLPREFSGVDPSALARIVASETVPLGEVVGVALGSGEAATRASDRSKPTRRDRELEWLRRHQEEIRVLAGQWVVIEGEAIVAVGRDPLEAVQDARRKGVQVPFVCRIEHERSKDVVNIGL